MPHSDILISILPSLWDHIIIKTSLWSLTMTLRVNQKYQIPFKQKGRDWYLIIYVEYKIKADILPQTIFAQGYQQDVDTKAEPESKVLDNINTFKNISLWYLIRTHYGIFSISTSYPNNEQHGWTILKIYIPRK